MLYNCARLQPLLHDSGLFMKRCVTFSFYHIFAVLALYSFTLHACEVLEREILENFGPSAVQLFQQITQTVTEKDPKAQFTLVEKLLTIKHSKPLSDKACLTKSNAFWLLSPQSSPDAETTVMKFETRVLPKYYYIVSDLKPI